MRYLACLYFSLYKYIEDIIFVDSDGDAVSTAIAGEDIEICDAETNLIANVPLIGESGFCHMKQEWLREAGFVTCQEPLPPRCWRSLERVIFGHLLVCKETSPLA